MSKIKSWFQAAWIVLAVAAVIIVLDQWTKQLVRQSIPEYTADLLPSRPTAASVTADEDPTLAEYNRYLAELAARNDAAGRTGTETPQDRTTA